MDRPRVVAFRRRRRADPAARRRDDPLEARILSPAPLPFAALGARIAHPIYAPVRRWFRRLAPEAWPELAALNALAEEAGVRTASGRPVRFVAPSPADPCYEMQVFESGRVATRAQNGHDLFNALCWLAFPLTKARVNALHAAEIPHEGGRRGPARDLLTIFDEGGAVVECADPRLESLIRSHQWKTLFWSCRERVLRGMRIVVIGHAALDAALDPWAGITCKVLFSPVGADADAFAAGWLERHARGGSPKLLAPLPVFGYPGWDSGSADPTFYDDPRFFRPRSVKQESKLSEFDEGIAQ